MWQKIAVCVQILTTVTCITLHLKSETGSLTIVDNVEDIIQKYKLFCGDELLCSTKDTKYNISGTCPKCNCDPECYNRGDCCPDIQLKFPRYAFRNSVVTGPEKLNSTWLMPVIDACPSHAKQQLKENCEREFTTSDIILHPPVKHSQYNIMFRNEYCAICNSVNSFIDLSTQVNCSKYVDLNFISSYDELSKIMENFCTMNFEYVSKISYNAIVNGVDRCNETGFWQTSNTIVEAACLSDYYLPYGNYKNIFCFMCNMPVIQNSTIAIIDKCNVTGQWDTYDESILEKCSNLGASSLTTPFKNIFCRICNLKKTLNSEYQAFIDASAKISHSFMKDSSSPSYFKSEIKVQNFFNTLHDLEFHKKKTTNVDLSVQSSMDLSTIGINISNIVQYDYASTGLFNYCEENLIPKRYVFEKKNCLCNLSCFFEHKGDCCLEIELYNPMSCMSKFLKPFTEELFSKQGPTSKIAISKYDSRQYIVVEKCLNTNAPDTLRTKCENEFRNFQDLKSFIPVTDVKTKLSFRNFYCYMCSSFPVNEYSVSYESWAVEVTCETPHFNEFRLSLSEAIDSVANRACTITTFPPKQFVNENKNIKYCGNRRSLDLLHCRNNDFDDFDLNWACENSSVLALNARKRFCRICSLSSSNTYLDTCQNKTHLYYGENINGACAFFPKTVSHLPYKNIFCESCVRGVKISIPFEVEIVEMDRDVFPSSIGDIFKPYPLNKKEIKIAHFHEDIDAGLFYDSITAKNRNVTCFPGKILFNSTCKPLISKTSGLRYIYAILLEANSTNNIADIAGAKKMRSVLQQKLVQVIQSASTSSQSIVFENYIQVSNCKNKILGIKSNNLYIYHKFVIRNEVHRQQLEENLVSVMNKDFAIKNERNETEFGAYFKSSQNIESYLLPSMENKHLHLGNCYEDLTYDHFEDISHIRPILVNELLLCTQVEFDQSEFILDKNDLNVRLSFIKTTSIHLLDYYITGEGKLRLCVEHYKNIILSQNKENVVKPITLLEKLVSVVSYVCAVVSLFFLLLTFLVYAFLPQMRSIPGINIMNLVISLAFALGLFIFGYKATQEFVLCAVIGVLCHFFWLCTFACMNVCSFHMHRLFVTQSSRIVSAAKFKRVLMYMLYSYGMPFMIVAITIAVFLSIDPSTFKGYGIDRCFISDFYASIFSFLCPVVLLCVCNIYFFVRTAISIKQAPKIDCNKERKNDFSILVKLFSLTGITWLFLIIDSLHEISLFSFLVNILVGCQGVFIFLSFICNKRVFVLLKNKFSSFASSSDTFESKASRSSAINSNSKSKTKSTFI